MHHHTDRITHTTAFVTPVVKHWLEREIAHWVHHMKDRSDDPSHIERTPLPRSYTSLPGYMASDIWRRTTQIAREETRCRHMGCSFRLAARALLYAPSHIQENTYHDLWYTSRRTLAGTWNSSMGTYIHIYKHTHIKNKKPKEKKTQNK